MVTKLTYNLSDFNCNLNWSDACPGKAIQMQHFPNWTFTDETYLLACLLHDIGTTDTNLQASLEYRQKWKSW